MMGRPGGGMIRGAGMGRPGPGQPPERSKDLRGTVRRLLARLRPERVRLVIVLVFGVTSVAFLVTGPKILGDATNVLFDGVVGKQFPAGITKDQAVALLRAHGQGQLADMISGMNITPGAGVDITQLGRVLGLAALVYLLGGGLQLGPGIHHGRRHPAHHVRAAPRGRGEAGPAAAAVLRQPPARRHPQPGHQRHRQPHHHAPAGTQPAAHLGADDHRRHGHDVLDLTAARRRYR